MILPGRSLLPGYAELHCRSAFSFGRGASLPEELVQRAHELGYTALALTDEASVAGVVRAHTVARQLGLQLITGAEFIVPATGARAAFTAVVLPHDSAGWAQLCGFITRCRCAAPKGQYRVRWPDPDWATLTACTLLLELPLAMTFEAAYAVCTGAAAVFHQNVGLLWPRRLEADQGLLDVRLQQLAGLCALPLLPAGGVLMHRRSRKPLQDVLSAVRHGHTLEYCLHHGLLQPNGEAHLRSRQRLAQLYAPDALERTLDVAARCRFSLDALRYHYPREALLPEHTPAQTLRSYTEQGAARRYTHGVPNKVRAQLEHELALIAELGYEMYFLTVHDIVRFARSRAILCQGRGSAANSAVCYCLGITEVDPERGNLLFERFISRERNEPPDIDVDFEHERREEVIQYLYAKYGRDRAALTATVIHYRPRSALRDVGRALGLVPELIDALSREHPGMYAREVLNERLESALRRLGPEVPLPHTAVLQRWLDLAQQLQRLPRHLSQHVGGFVLTDAPLTQLVPVEPAAMDRRSVIQWDKDDLDAVGLLKVDVLALGMLSALRRCLALVAQRRGQAFTLQDIPADDAATFTMIAEADTVGVFQIESRAQMSMLPRLRPRCFYDLVVQVAIVRPGPIQGGMVHPYLQARANPLAVHYANPKLKAALERTLGVPIFQEQVMQIAMLAADFTPGEADALRRSMAAWRRKGGVHAFYDRLVGGMLKNGYSREYADTLVRQIEGFGEYGFPESHAASFALLAWSSSWLKCHEPACFLAALLNSQPMGFYQPAQLVQDARRHGVAVLPVDVLASEWECTLEKLDNFSVRLGLCMVRGLSRTAADRIVQARHQAPWRDVADLAQQAGLDAATLRGLTKADALAGLAGNRRRQLWQASVATPLPPLLREAAAPSEACPLPAPSLARSVQADYAALGLSLRCHPLSLLRSALSKQELATAAQLQQRRDGQLVATAGLVTVRQQPGTAKGVVFVTLEDETGSVNVIVWPDVKQRQRQELLHARLLAVHGRWQRDATGKVSHLVAQRLTDLSAWLGDLEARSRDFC